MSVLYRCPVCRERLEKRERSYVCGNGHVFDIASEGYVNFAAVKKTYSADTGDAADSCRARRAFLEAGFYAPLAEALAAILSDRADDPSSLVVDAGCGEGYYDRYILEKKPSLALCGFDLAKVGIKLAAKRQKNRENPVEYAVAGIFDMPLFDASASDVLSVFAPVPDKEAYRVLRENGRMIVVSPGKRHLFGLKAALYDTPTENEEKTAEYEGFSLKEVRRVTYPMTLPGTHAETLFAMTPYFFRSAKEVREKAENLGEIVSDADFLIRIYDKCDKCGTKSVE